MWTGFIFCSLIIIPIVFYGITLINRLHLWTQPLWLTLMLLPFYFVLTHEPRALEFMSQYSGKISQSSQFDPYYFGIAMGISLALIAQIGEQVDYLRFMPNKNKSNKLSWWFTVMIAGPGWIILGFAKQMGGVLLASLAVLAGLSIVEAKEPMHMYTVAYNYVFENQQFAFLITFIFVIISQIKINVTNAYAGSLAWSNFFSRVTHSHPGRVVWMVFNIAIALMLMEMGVFDALVKILGLYSNIAIAWIGAVVADLVINKPCKLSPPIVEFKRAHLYDFNPVGFFSMIIASLLSIAAFTGVFGLYAQAYSSLIALLVSFSLSPLIAFITQGKYYIARPNLHYSSSNKLETCSICEQQYAETDFAFCTFYESPICSLCCTLDANCHDHCKPQTPPFHQVVFAALLKLAPKNIISENTSNRLANFLLIWGGMITLISITMWLIFSIQTEGFVNDIRQTIYEIFLQIFVALTFFTSIASWWIVLIHESRKLSETELSDQIKISQKNYQELTTTHKKLEQSELLFRELIQAQSAIFWRADVASHQLTFVSNQVKTITGYSARQWLSKDFWGEHVHKDDRKKVLTYCLAETKALRNHEFEYRIITASGKVIWLRNTVNLIVKNNQVHELSGLAIDITQNKADREKIQYLSDLYATLSKINHAIVHIDNEAELFNKICAITVKFRSLNMAWVGTKRDSDQHIIPIASAGEHLDYLDNIYVSADANTPEGRGPTGTSYRQKEIITTNQLSNTEHSQPWQQKIKLAHWESSCAIPILRNKQAFAVLNVYSKIPNYFSDEIIHLLSELGSDLTFALDSIDRETARKKAEKSLELSAKVFAQSQEAIMITDSQNHIISVNEAFTRITGYSSHDALGKLPSLLSSSKQDITFYKNMWQEIKSENYWQGEIWNRRKNGEIFPEWMTISAAKDQSGNISNYIAIFSDISQHKETEARIEHLAHYDALTDLPNRILLKAHIDHEILTAERNDTPIALLFLDLDHFKNINDSLGHSVGDQLLIAVAKKLKLAIRDEDTVSRLGGDEFNILLPNTNFKGAALVAEKVINLLSEKIHIDKNQLHISSSIGISLFPENGTDYETLYKNADTALYQAKDKGRNQYQFFTHEMQVFTQHRLEIENHLRYAIEKNELSISYQPQIDAQTKQIIGAEALLRWSHPQWGMVSPAEFISVAESTGLIIPIGDWVLNQAIAQTKKWHDAGYDSITIAINLSLAQFSEATLFEKIKTILVKNNLAPHYLELELTESIAMKNADAAIKITQQLASLGIQLSIDDFGTGYSSLSYLQRFALHKLKIDQSFISKMLDNKETENIINAIISLAQSLNLKTIAEGVETIEQLTMLIQKDCDEIQGYYFSKALPVAEFTSLLSQGFKKL